MTSGPLADYAKGFGGKFGIETDKVDKSAVGFEYQGKTERHESQKGNRRQSDSLRPAAYSSVLWAVLISVSTKLTHNYNRRFCFHKYFK